MIDLEKAKEEFNKYTNAYDNSNEKVMVKINHTYGVLKVSEYIAKSLKLSEEDIELAILIGLLHDIGRFEQARIFNNFDDYKNIDHAEIGVNILFDKKLIRKFIEDDKYDSIIYKAILNHNKYEIEDELSEKELLHAKIIRDADKTDNLRVKQFQSLLTLTGEEEKNIGKYKITPKIYNDFMNHKTIITSEKVTPMDDWVSYIAFIFDYNFVTSLEYIKEKDYINILINRIKYIDTDTIEKMENIKNCVLGYMEERIINKNERERKYADFNFSTINFC